MQSAAPTWSWREEHVDREREHLTLSHDDWAIGPVAFVGPARERIFPVEFAADVPAEIREAVVKELDYYLVSLGEEDPWSYAHYHVGTSSNLYGSVHWDVGSGA